MAQNSLFDQKTGLIGYNITVDGSALPDGLNIASISVHKSLNKIATAKIEIWDGDNYSTDFKIIEEKSYEAGAEVEISVGYQTQTDLIFKGIIVKHGVKITSNKASKIILECSDEAIVLTGQRESKIFENMKDSAIINQIASNYQVSVTCDGTDTQHETIMQQNCTAWDFILTRAQANYFVVLTEDGELKVKKPSSGAKKDLKVVFGENINAMDVSIDARTQLLEVETAAWDYKKQEIVTGKSKEPDEVDKLGNIKGKTIAGKLNYKKTYLQSTGKMEKKELDKWAESTLLLSRLSRVRGTIDTQGFAKINPNDFLIINEVGKYFDGEAYVSGVHHHLNEGNWLTKIELGVKPELFIANKNDVTLPPADGLFPAVTGLFIGKVLKVDGDPKGENRILVEVPMVEKDGKGAWARVSNIMASKDFGSVFYPEVDDEVVLGALGGDLRFPIVLGHLYSSGREYASDFNHTNDNHEKGWKTRSGMLFHFDDKDSIIRLETPGGQKLILDDKDKSITLEDQHKNKMVMDSSGFKFSGNKDFVVDVKGKIDEKAIGAVKIESKSGKLTGKGMQGVTFTDVSGSKLEAAAMGVTVSSNAMATLKGSVVMIN